jgi:hypothetical protein
MYWAMEIEKHWQQVQITAGIELEYYEDKISAACLLKDITQLHRFYKTHIFESDLLLAPVYMKVLLFRIYYAELHINPWGLATLRLAGRKIQHRGKHIQLCRFPNFLLPTDCLYCGESLGFKTYEDTSIKLTKHPDCTHLWDKGIRKKHLAAMEAMHQVPFKDPNCSEVVVAFEQLSSSYQELIHLYEKPYQPRYQLIQAYQEIPVEAWLEPLIGFEPRQAFWTLPFLKPEVQQFDLCLSEEVDGEPLRWEEFDLNTQKPVIGLGELDAYFVKNPQLR